LPGLNLPDYYNPVFSPDGKKIAVVSKDLSIQLFDTETGYLIHTMEGTHYLSYDLRVSFTKNGDKLFSWQPFGIPVLWDVKTGEVQKAYTTDLYQAASRAAMEDANKNVHTSTGGSGSL